MNKEQLIAAGFTEEQAVKITEMHNATISGNYIPKSRLDEVITERNQLREQVTQRDGQLETLRTETGAAEKLKIQIAELQTINTEAQKRFDAEMKRVKRDGLDERLLNEAKAINPLACKPFLPVIDEAIDDGGYTALRKQHIDAISQADNTKFLFQQAAQQQQFVGIKPGEKGEQSPAVIAGSNPFAKDTYDEAAQVKLFRDNPEMARALARQAGYRHI